MKTPSALAVAAISVAAAAQLMAAFTPSFYELRDPNRGKPNRQGLRDAFIVGGGLAVILGSVGSAATGSPLPFISSVGGVLMLFALYEWAVDHPHSGA